MNLRQETCARHAASRSLARSRGACLFSGPGRRWLEEPPFVTWLKHAEARDVQGWESEVACVGDVLDQCESTYRNDF